MSTISSHTQNFSGGSIAISNGAKTSADSGLPKMSAGLSGLRAVSGATPLSAGNPGFGSRSHSQLGLSSFLG